MGGKGENEKVEGECLFFGAGADKPGTTELGNSEFWTGVSGIGTNVCTWADCDFEDLEFSGSAGAGIPCIHCQ